MSNQAKTFFVALALLTVLVSVAGMRFLQTRETLPSLVHFELLREMDDPESVRELSFSPDGQYLATISSDIHLWRVSDGAFVTRLQHETDVLSVAFFPDSTLLISGGIDAKVRLWHIPDGTLLHVYEIPSQNTLSHSPTLITHRPESGPPINTIASVAVAADGHMIAAGTWGGDIFLWDTRTNEIIQHYQLATQDCPARPIQFSPDGQYLAAGACGLTLWKITHEQPVYYFPFQDIFLIESLSFSPDGDELVFGAGRKGITLLRLHNMQVVKVTDLGKNYGVKSLAFHPGGKMFAVFGWNEQFDFWHVSSKEALEVAYTPKAPTGASILALSPDGKILATAGDYEGNIQLWSVLIENEQ